MLSELPFSFYWEDETTLVSFVPDRSFTPGSPKIFCPGTKCRLDWVNRFLSLKIAHSACRHTLYLSHTHTHTHYIYTHTNTSQTHTHKHFLTSIYIYTHTRITCARWYRHGLPRRQKRLKQNRASTCLLREKKLLRPRAVTVQVYTWNKDHNWAVAFVWWNLNRASLVTW